MAREWNCPRCSAKNSDDTLTCSACGLIRGSVVPTPQLAPPSAPSWAPREPDSPRPIDVPVTEPPGVDAGLAAPEAVPAAAPRRRRIPIRLVAIVAIIGAGLVAGWIINAGRSSTGEIVKSGDLVVSDLRVGDCFDLKDAAAEIHEKVTARPCGEEHEFELFYVGSLPEGPYPTDVDTSFGKFVQDNCGPAFESYVGKAYESSELEVFWFYPNGDSWAKGDRAVQCAVYHPRIHRLKESLKGSNR